MLAVSLFSISKLAHRENSDSDRAYAMLFDSASESDIDFLMGILPCIKTSWWREYALSRVYALDNSVSMGEAARSLKNPEFIAYVYAAKSLDNPGISADNLALGIRDLLCAEILRKIWSGQNISVGEVEAFSFNSFPRTDAVLRNSYGNLFLREIVKTGRFDLIAVFNKVFKYDILNLALSLSGLGAKQADFSDSGKNYEIILSTLYSSYGDPGAQESMKLKQRIARDLEAMKCGVYLWRKSLLAQALYNLGEGSAAAGVFEDLYSYMMSPPLKNYQARQVVREMALGFAVQNKKVDMALKYIESAPTKEFELKMLSKYSFLLGRYWGVEKAFELIDHFARSK